MRSIYDSASGDWYNPPTNPPEDPIYPPEDYDFHFGVEGKNKITRGRVRRRIRAQVKNDDTYSRGDLTGEMIAIVDDPVNSSSQPTDDGDSGDNNGGSTQSSADQGDTVTPTDSGSSDKTHPQDDVPEDSSDEDSSGHSDLVTDGGPIYVDIGNPKLPTGGGHVTPIFTGWRPTEGTTLTRTGTPFAVDTGNDDRLTAAVKRAAAYDEFCWIVCDSSGRYLMQTNHCSIKELKNIINSTWVPTTNATYYVLYEITSEGVKEYSYESSSGYLNTTHSSSEQRLNDIFNEVSEDRGEYEEAQNADSDSDSSVETPEDTDDDTDTDVDWWSDPSVWGGGYD